MADSIVTSAAQMKAKTDRWVVVNDEIVGAWVSRLLYRIDLVAGAGRYSLANPWVDSTLIEPNGANKAEIKQLFVTAGYEWGQNDESITWESA